MEQVIESQEFRRLARANCYRYGCLYIYSDRYVSLDEHNFPSYQSREGTGSVEKFLTLIQSLGANAGGNDPKSKLSKPLPGVQWQGDRLELTINLDGVMYFTDYRDYVTVKKNLRSEMLAQGWKQFVSKSETLNMSLASYKPARGGDDALYNDDPMDAAGMAMMTSAMQHTSAQAQITVGYATGNKEMYAEGKARSGATMSGQSAGVPVIGGAIGIGANMQAGLEALGSNMNSGVAGKWMTAGHPVELIIEGQVARQSVNGVLTSAKFTEKGYAADDTSGGNVYPTAMDVSISITNMYGSLYNTSSSG